MPKKHQTDSNSHFGKRLADMRKAAGYTQVELAEIVGISQRMISYYESTDDHPIAKVLRHLAHALNVGADDLLGAAPLPAGKRKPTQRRKV